jgi:hypothetical protein
MVNARNAATIFAKCDSFIHFNIVNDIAIGARLVDALQSSKAFRNRLMFSICAIRNGLE